MKAHDDDPDAVETDPTDALQNALAGEHAAVYAYGVIAGRLPADSPAGRQAAAAFVLHRRRRDDLIARLTADGQVPVEAEPAYRTGPVAGDDDARRLAQQVEGGLTRSWLAVVGPADDDLRSYACDAVVDSATALLAWGGTPGALPGTA